MRKRRLAAGLLSVFLGILLFGGCGRQTAASDKVYVGVACYNESDVFIGELIDCLKEELNELSEEGIETTVTIRDAAGSQRTQNDQVKALIDEGSNVLCINLVDRADPSEIIDMARENDVPVIFFNREPVAEDMMQWEKLYYVGAKAKQSGVMQGELAAELIHSDRRVDRNRDGKIQYVVLEGEPGHQDAIVRTEYSVNTIVSSGIEVEKLGYAIANWNRAQAQNKMTQLLSQNGNKIELVIANNDDMAVGAIDALKASDLSREEWPVVVGIDGTDVGLEAVKNGEMVGTVYNDKEGQAKGMLELSFALATGGNLEDLNLEDGKYIRMPYAKVGPDDVDEYLDR